MGSQSHQFFAPAKVLLWALFIVSVASEVPVNNQATKKIDVSDGKLKRQNAASGSRGEEVDLSTIPVSQAGGSATPQQPGQTPFFTGNPFLQQPFFGNGLGYPGGQQAGFSVGQQSGFPGQQAGFPGFTNSFPQGFPQGYPQVNYPNTGAGRNVILQNNGKQYLVQELTDQQRVVQKNGKQYLLQPFTGTNGVLGLQGFNVPNSVIPGLSSPYAQSGTLGALGSLSSLPIGGDGQLNYAGSAFQPTRSSSAPQRLLLNGNGQQIQVDQSSIRSNYLSPQLVSAGQQYASQYVPFGLSSGLSPAYGRANDAGYGLYSTGRDDIQTIQGPQVKRNVKDVADRTKPRRSR